ncbi:hypothetical protein [Nocardioides halotolerans]|uniref:hypothetical protein n=1 Tax=Nocardioides halotolerans TaxID=433660 RepID=UPI0012F7506A|nr:hypothetical protein [Nocardioides halotolerans]
MMTMLRGGRGGEVRLKLYLSLLWIAVAPPHNVSYPARTWAALVGLADPPGRGARRINDALRWLSENDFVEVQGEKGVPPIVTVRSESGDGSRYSLPGSTIKRLQLEGKPWNRHAYEKVPGQLWTNGWMAALDGPALACLLVLRSVPPAVDAVFDVGAWFSPALLRERYDMSDDTRKRGMRRLNELGIIKTESRVLGRTSADFQRSRTEYHLQAGVLAQSPFSTPSRPIDLGHDEARL